MSEENYNLENISTFVALPIDTIYNGKRSDQFRVIQNVVIKTLSDGSLCIMETSNPDNIPQQQAVDISYSPIQQNEIKTNSTEKPQIIVNNVDNITVQKTSPIYKCPKCKEVFNKIANYRKHMIWHRNVKKYKCDKCSVTFNVETNLKVHMAVHTEGKPTCTICGVSFQRLASLKSHLMIHQVEELHTCEDCGAEFEKEEELNKHVQTHLNTSIQENNNLICSYCNVQFEDRKNYKEHITHHIKVKKLVLSGKKTRKTNGNKIYPHVCSVCLKSFSKFSLLERHLRVHSGERPFICEYCNKGFNQKGTLQIHLNKHTGVKPFQCTLCSAKFNQKGNLRVHVEKTHTAPLPGMKMYKCPHCTCIFKKIASLNVHIAKCHANCEDLGDINTVMNKLKDLQQQAGGSSETGKETNEENLRVINEIKKVGEVTNTSYVRLAESFLDGTIRRYLVMQKKVNDTKFYICSYCSKEFKKPSDLIRHTRVHTREKPFSCKHCGAKFSLKSSLFCHIKTHVSGNNCLCNICMKKFSSVRSMKLHLRKHADKPQYNCASCNKIFNSLQKAKHHEKEFHSSRQSEFKLKQPLINTPNGLLPIKLDSSATENLKQHQCLVCSAKFTKLPSLKRHMLVHNGEKKFKCDQCLKAYFTAHALKEHKLYHTGVRNFTCKYCGKKFMTSSLLKRHLICHTTIRPYVCPYCNKNFKSLLLCRKHINTHKKDANLQIEDDGQTELEVDKSNSEVNSNNNIILSSETLQDNSEIRNSLYVAQGTEKMLTQDLSVGQNQLYEIPANAIQIITNSDKDLATNPNEIQTIFINYEDLQLPENLYNQNSDTILFNSFSDLPENTFTIDPLGVDFNSQNIEVYNQNELNNDQSQSINVVDINNKILKVNGNVNGNKAKSEKQPTSSVNLNDSVLSNYCSPPELNLLFNLDPEFGGELPNENLNLSDINLPQVPILNAQENSSVKEDRKSEKEAFSCSKCNKIFSTKKTYMKHLQIHKDPKKASTSHECMVCAKTFKKHSDLVRHIRTHTGERPFACDKCDKRFSLKSTLISHQKTHNPVIHKQFSCIVCNSYFSSKSSLKVHMSVHTGDKAHKCSYCEMKFRTAAHRKSHENNYHVSPKKKAKNKVTNILASVAMDVLDQNNSQNEQVINGGDLENVLVVQEQFSADQINLIADANHAVLDANQLDPLIFQQLQQNILIQDNLIPSSLIQLDSGTVLNVKTVSETDQGTVEKTRNFECDICNKRYASKDVLRKHKKTHGIDKKFKCTKCEKGFDNEESLQIHEKTHEGFRPFSCLYCANSFSKEHSLATHMKRIHNSSLKDILL